MKTIIPQHSNGRQLGADFGDSIQDAFPGAAGKAATEAIIVSGYARDREALRAAYETGKPQIDRYIQQIDLSKVVREGSRGALQENELMKGAVIGAGAMLALTWIF